MSDILFSPGDLIPLHRYCLHYRSLVRSGQTPTQEQDERFMRYQEICYAEGVAHE
jgi:hypothetical protein